MKTAAGAYSLHKPQLRLNSPDNNNESNKKDSMAEKSIQIRVGIDKKGGHTLQEQ